MIKLILTPVSKKYDDDYVDRKMMDKNKKEYYKWCECLKRITPHVDGGEVSICKLCRKEDKDTIKFLRGEN